jgi:hypothetical protein
MVGHIAERLLRLDQMGCIERGGEPSEASQVDEGLPAHIDAGYDGI